MFNTLGALLAVCLQIGVVFGAGGKAEYSKNWNYEEMGPSVWSKNFSICGNRAQSPINILSDDAIYDENLGTLELHNYEQTVNVSFTMKNRQSDIEFAAAAPTGAPKEIPQAVTFKGTKYRLYQFHFHWGSKNFQGSEHLLDSQQYAAEMHVIHYNDKYDHVGKAIDQADGLLVWGHFLKVASGKTVHNAKFQELLDQFSNAEQCCNTKDLTLNLRSLLPDESEDFYHYQGSLTTPPCFESVKWIVNRNPLLVSEKQMATFRTLKTTPGPANQAFVALADNYRPAMPLNDRSVYANFESAGASLKPFTGLLFTFIVLLYSMM